MDIENNVTFCILREMLDTDQLVEIVERARIVNVNFHCPECGKPDVRQDDKWKMTHSSSCVIGAVETYCVDNGFIERIY